MTDPDIARSLATASESLRLEALRDLGVLDSAPEEAFDDLAKLAAIVCQVPIALVSLVDADRQWFKARCGLDAQETPRDVAFCAHAIKQAALFEVPDATLDPRFADNPLVTGEPHIRFYAGVPLSGSQGYPYGTLCVIDVKPRLLTEEQRDGLARLARRASDALETRRLKRRAEDRESTLTQLLEAMPDGVVTCDAGGLLGEFNRTARDWHGIDPRVLPPEEWAVHFGLYRPDGDALLPMDEVPLLRALRGEHVREAEIIIRAAGQPERIVRCSVEPVRAADGTLLGAVCVMQDVTRRKQAELAVLALNAELQANAEQLQQSNRELEAFSYTISHDLRAPLRHIDGYARMLQEDAGDQLDAEMRRYLDAVGDSARQMGALIDDLLAFSKLGRKQVERVDVDMGALVQGVAEELRVGGDPRVSIGPLPAALADPVLFKQVWLNLLSNAIKYSAPRGGAARVEVSGERNGDRVQYRVRDNGVGFDMRYADKLFGVFQRLHSQDEFEGTGVGLAIVQRIVARHGGSIAADSQPGLGATFTFEFPLLTDSPPDTAAMEASI